MTTELLKISTEEFWKLCY